MVADMLEEAGFTNVYSLEGGMKGWSGHLEPVKIADLNGGGSLYQFVRLGKGCLSYFIESNGEAAIVDTARMTAVYKKFAEEQGVQIKLAIDRSEEHTSELQSRGHLVCRLLLEK